MVVPDKPGQKSSQDPILTENAGHSDIPVIPAMAGSINRRITVQISLGKRRSLS
jgi:hypothetical protein